MRSIDVVRPCQDRWARVLWPRRSRRPARVLSAGLSAALSLLSACHEPAAAPPSNNAPATVEPPAAPEISTPVAAAPERITIPAQEDDPDRWLFVQKVKDGERGAWATGTFNAKRNKIEIQTRGAQAFAIDTARIPIIWERLVIIGVDGVNSELRKRDYRIYQFKRGDLGQWVVVEP